MENGNPGAKNRKMFDVFVLRGMFFINFFISNFFEANQKITRKMAKKNIFVSSSCATRNSDI